MRRARVLVVDDSEPSAEVMIEVLSGFGVRNIRKCSSSEEARRHAAAQAFDLLIVDMEMPGEDGIAFTRSVRAQEEGPNFTSPIVLVSGFTPMQKVFDARDAGANMVLAKPVSPPILLERIEWIARNTRQFVNSADYCGPDRRFRRGRPPEGVEERRAGAIALMSDAERALSQDDIDSIFG
jgi:CheY-like chemotaxis protein